jgi:ADP-ribose pyrophosphatase YjhB (NUDIX family)
MKSLNCNVSVIIIAEKKIMLAKRDENDSIFPGYWAIPGGNYEPQDTSLEDIAIRECEEEVGIILSKKNLHLYQNNIRHDSISQSSKLYVTYITQLEREKIEYSKKSENKEISEIQFMKKEIIEKNEKIIPYTKMLLLETFSNNENFPL